MNSVKKSTGKRDLSDTRKFPFTASDLPIDDEGRIYHLQVKPEQLARDILIVGDPGRAEMIGEAFLKNIEFTHEHRGLVTITGTSDISGEPATVVSPARTTVTTSGMGTPSFEIIIQELVALNEIDFQTLAPKSAYKDLQVIRVGTSGGLQASTKLGTPIITSYSIGMDNTGVYYDAPYPDEHCKRLENELSKLLQSRMKSDSRFYGKLNPYVSRADPAIVSALSEASDALGVTSKIGLTVSCSGFFAPQGRNIARIKPTIPDLDQVFSEYDPGLGGQKVENMEMESSFLNHFFGGLGYSAGAICTAIANRQENSFDHNYQVSVANSIRVALLALSIARSKK